MPESLQTLFDWVSAHPLLAGIAIFLVAFSESVAIFGLLVPGVVLMFGFGALITAGALEFWPVFFWAVAGAVAGDGISFWLGRHYKDQLRGLWPFRRHPETLNRGISFFQRYGGKSVALGRFFGPVRAVIPLVAGMMGMTPWRFLLANVLSAVAWAPAYLFPGMVFGASLELAAEVAFRLVVLAVALGVLVVLVIWSAKRVFRLLHPHARSIVQGLLAWSQAHPFGGRIAAALADPNHPEARGLAAFATLLLLATLSFGLVFGAVIEGSIVHGLNHAVFETLQSLRTPWGDHLMLYFSRLADSGVMLPLILVVLVFLTVQQHWRAAGYWLAAAAFAMLASTALKYGLRIPRPEPGIDGLTPWAFPSTHTLRATVIYGFLGVMIARSVAAQRRWMVYSLASLAIIAVSLARLYLGAHWLTDVLGSQALGLAWVSALAIAYSQHTEVETHWLGLSSLACGALAAAFSYQSWAVHSTDLASYQPSPEIRSMAADSWWESGWSRFPRFRNDIRARQDHPLNLQYAGSLDALEQRLHSQGWRPSEMLDWANSLKLLSPSLTLRALPVLPQVHAGRHEVLTLEKPVSQTRRLVLRLWPSHYRLTPGAIPLWLGAVSSQEKAVVLDFLTFPSTGSDYTEAFAALARDLQATGFETRRASDRVTLVREHSGS